VDEENKQTATTRGVELLKVAKQRCL